MAKAQKPNEGKLNKNHKKAKSTHKDWYGFLRIGPDLLERIKAGEELSLSAWTNDGGEAGPWISIRLEADWRTEKPRLETQEAATPRAAPPSLDDSEAPF